MVIERRAAVKRETRVLFLLSRGTSLMTSRWVFVHDCDERRVQVQKVRYYNEQWTGELIVGLVNKTKVAYRLPSFAVTARLSVLI
jgi:hypothetical protein